MKRNPDVSFRRLQRRAAGGDPEHQARAIVESVRYGRLDPDRVVLAAVLSPFALEVARGMGLKASPKLQRKIGPCLPEEHFSSRGRRKGHDLQELQEEVGLLCSEIVVTFISKKASVRKRLIYCLAVEVLNPFKKTYTRGLRADDMNLFGQSIKMLKWACEPSKKVPPRKKVKALESLLGEQYHEMDERAYEADSDRTYNRYSRCARVAGLLREMVGMLADRHSYTDLSKHFRTVSAHAWYLEDSIRPKIGVPRIVSETLVQWLLDPEIQ